MVSFRVQGTTPQCQTAGQRAAYRASWLSDTCELHEKNAYYLELSHLMLA